MENSAHKVYIVLCFIMLLAWEPSVQDTHSYSRARRLPALFFTGKLTFRYKIELLKLESQNHTKNILVGLPSSLIKIWGKSVQGF